MSLEKDITQIKEDMFKPASKKEVKVRRQQGWVNMDATDRMMEISDAFITHMKSGAIKVLNAYADNTAPEEIEEAYYEATEYFKDQEVMKFRTPKIK